MTRHGSRTSPRWCGQLSRTPDPVAAFRSLDLAARRSVIDALCVVTLLRTVPGRVGLDPDTVRIDWRKSDTTP